MGATCDICGEKLTLPQYLYCLRHRGKLTYPFRGWDGQRVENPMQWLCTRCTRRARRHREEAHSKSSTPAVDTAGCNPTNSSSG